MAEPAADERDRPRWFDSHCHLQEAYLPREGQAAGEDGAGEDEAGEDGACEDGSGADPVGEALAACRAAGVERLVCVGTDAATSEQALEMARATGAATGGAPQVWATAGLHPHEASSGDLARIEELVERELGSRRSADGPSPLVAVGECGLDYHYDHSAREAQRAVFARQVQLAHRHDLPLVVHAREAWDDVLELLRAEGVPRRCVVHCFTGGPDEARRCLDAGTWLSFSGIVTFKNAADVRAAAALCPLDRLLVETDSPFLAPVPHRGRTNQPAFVPKVGEAVAAAKDMDPADLARASWEAASSFFGV